MNEIATNAEAYTQDKIDLIKRTVAAGATNDELQMFLHQCKRTGLDPLARQIYCIKMGNKISIQASIDGLRLVADRTNRYAPVGTEYKTDKNGELLSAVVTVKKLVAGEWHEVKAEAFFNEYRQNSPTWARMPRVMLAKCAEALALRKAFPAELSGVYSDDEMAQADSLPHSVPPSASPPTANHDVSIKMKIANDMKAMGLSDSEVKKWGAEIVELYGGLEQAAEVVSAWRNEGRVWDAESESFVLAKEA